MTLSEGRLSHLAHLVLKALGSEQLVRVRNERLFLNLVKQALTDTLSTDERLDRLVRARMPKRVPPGSREWDVLYKKLYEEERRKLGDR
ncbi:MAG TPA: DUF507 family protein [Candidatus Limnocylindria bacterium]|nr:DUF507 family protein [Candidatus Limnocylindria bacterium]